MAVFDITHLTNPIEDPENPPKWPQSHDKLDICSLRFSPNQVTLAIGCFNGDIYIRSAVTSHIMYRIRATRVESPISSISWHPTIQNALICTSANGYIMAHHIESGQLLWEIEEKGNSINSLRLSPTGSRFATVGSDCSVRVYNTLSKQLDCELASKVYIQGQVSGHENRVFSSVFLDINTIASSGWDDTILIWDTRSNLVTKTISGPHVCGEAMEVIDDKIVTGSYRHQKQLELYDVRFEKCLKSVTVGTKDDPIYINSLRYNPDTKTIIVGGSGSNRVGFFNENLSLLGYTPRYSASVNAVDLNKFQFATGLSNSDVYVQTYIKTK